MNSKKLAHKFCDLIYKQSSIRNKVKFHLFKEKKKSLPKASEIVKGVEQIQIPWHTMDLALQT